MGPIKYIRNCELCYNNLNNHSNCHYQQKCYLTKDCQNVQETCILKKDSEPDSDSVSECSNSETQSEMDSVSECSNSETQSEMDSVSESSNSDPQPEMDSISESSNSETQPETVEVDIPQDQNKKDDNDSPIIDIIPKQSLDLSNNTIPTDLSQNQI